MSLVIDARRCNAMHDQQPDPPSNNRSPHHKPDHGPDHNLDPGLDQDLESARVDRTAVQCTNLHPARPSPSGRD